MKTANIGASFLIATATNAIAKHVVIANQITGKTRFATKVDFEDNRRKFSMGFTECRTANKVSDDNLSQCTVKLGKLLATLVDAVDYRRAAGAWQGECYRAHDDSLFHSKAGSVYKRLQPSIGAREHAANQAFFECRSWWCIHRNKRPDDKVNRQNLLLSN